MSGRSRGFTGFEMGDKSGLSGGAGSSDVKTGGNGARSGSYFFNSKVTVAALDKSLGLSSNGLTPGSGELFDCRAIVPFRVITHPSASGLRICSLSNALALEMNTAGGLRVVMAGTTPGSYTGGLAEDPSQWYYAVVRYHGLNPTSGKDNSGRKRGTIDVYTDDGTLVFAGTTQTQTDVPLVIFGGQACSVGAPHDCVVAFGSNYDTKNWSASSNSFQTVATHVTGYGIVVSNMDGAWCGLIPAAWLTSETSFETMPGPFDTGIADAGGTGVEQGLLQGVALGLFTVSNTVPFPSELLCGQDTNGVSCTREIDYDDAVFDYGTGADWADVGFVQNRLAVTPFPVTGQGAFDGFTPSGGFARVAERPKDLVASNTSSTLNAKTTYTHAPMVAGNVAYAAKVSTNATSDGNTHAILVGATSVNQLFDSNTDDVNDSTARAYDWYSSPEDKAFIDALEYGVQNKVNASPLTVLNILLEVLQGSVALTVDAGPDQVIAVQGATLTGVVTPDSATVVWEQISGPSSAAILTPTQLITDISSLVAGTYVFQITADNGIDTPVTDTVSITVGLPDEVEFANGQGTVGLAWVEFLDSLNSLHVWAKPDLPDPAFYYGGFKEGRVIHWGLISRALSDRDGQYEASAFNWTVSDKDRNVRGLLADPTTRYFQNRPIVARMIADLDRRALLTPRTMFRGIMTIPAPGAALVFDFTAEDPLARLFSVQDDKNQVPNRRITAADFPNCGASFTSASGAVVQVGAALLAVPIIYGRISDTNTTSSTIVNTNALTEDPTLTNAGEQIPANANGVSGVSTFAVGQGIRYALTVIKGGLEGPFTRIIGTMNMLFPASSTTALNFDQDPSVDSYRVYMFDGWFNPNNPAESSGNSFVRFKTHDNSTMDGDYGHAFHVEFNGPADGTDFFAAGTTTTVTTDQGKGQCPYIYVGQRDFSGTLYHGFLIAGHACKSIDEIYVDDVAVGIATTRDGWRIPGYDAIPKFETINGHDYSVVYGRVGFPGPDKGAGIGTPGPEGAIPLSFSVQGIESVGDGSGTLITDLLMQYRHAMQNWVLGSWQTGAWLTTPVYDDDVTVPQMDDASFDVASAQAVLRLAGGYVGDFVIGAKGESISVRDLVAQFNICADVNSGFNRFSQFFVSMVPDTIAALATAHHFTDRDDIFSDTFTIEDQQDDWFNAIPFQHTPDYLGRSNTGWLFPSGSDDPEAGVMEDLISQAGYNQRKKSTRQDLALIRGSSTATDPSFMDQGALVATDIIQRRLIRVAEPPRQATFYTGFKGLSVELGDVILITHYQGVGADGWAERPCRVIRHEVDPDGFQVGLTVTDLGRLFETGTFLGDEATLPAAHGDASDAERRYLYLCDETTGLFGDGSPGQRLR